MGWHRTRGWKVVAAGCASAALLGAAAVSAAAGTAGATGPSAHAARSIKVNDVVRLHLVRKSGSTLQEAGTATGSVPGSVRARFKVTVAIVSGTITIYPRSGGSVTMSAVGVPSSTGVRARFSGSLRITGGTGRYAHARGKGSFSGMVNRRSWAATVNAHGQMSY